MKKILILNIDVRLHRKIDDLSLSSSFEFAKADEFQIILEHNKKLRVFLRGSEDFSFRAIFFRIWKARLDVAIPIYQALSQGSIPIIGDEIKIQKHANKVIEYIQFHNQGIRIPLTIFIPRKYLHKYIGFLEENLTYPFIMKGINAKKGEHNYLVKSHIELISILEQEITNMEFVFQEFIPNTFDYRFVVLGYKTKLVYKRRRPEENSSHLNNLSQGGAIEKVPLDSVTELARIAEHCAKLLQRDVCGVDILPGLDGKHYVLEANAEPGVEGFTAADEVLNYLLSR